MLRTGFQRNRYALTNIWTLTNWLSVWYWPIYICGLYIILVHTCMYRNLKSTLINNWILKYYKRNLNYI